MSNQQPLSERLRRFENRHAAAAQHIFRLVSPRKQHTRTADGVRRLDVMIRIPDEQCVVWVDSQPRDVRFCAFDLGCAENIALPEDVGEEEKISF